VAQWWAHYLQNPFHCLLEKLFDFHNQAGMRPGRAKGGARPEKRPADLPQTGLFQGTHEFFEKEAPDEKSHETLCLRALTVNYIGWVAGFRD
jgi:hypothetical protein